MPFMNISRSLILSVSAPFSSALIWEESATLSRIAIVLLTIGSHDFQFVSPTHELNILLFQLAFQPTPIVASFCIVRFVIDGAHDICS